MKKILAILIVFNILFTANQTSAALVGASPSFNCQISGGVYENNICRYICKVGTSTRYFSSKDDSYKQCLEEEKQRQTEEQAEEEQRRAEEQERIYNERREELSAYKDFFEKVGVNLTAYTSTTQYEQWRMDLKEAESNYIKDQENQQKIKELEERIRTLESKPVIVDKIIAPKEGIIKQEINNKIVKPIIKKEEPKKDFIEEKILPVIETSTITEVPVIHKNTSIFQRIFNWFRSW